ncbi:TetR family transcriptional regulator C-terminal domain-containing protein [Paenibacillus sp. LHD-117]|uniref:TetR/AcrR family transcriptional regulator n=1 Tax=Paenibacillus sp. LHD-117 TaxID=3071412 RepID=UPI0027E02EF8|nr:TetR family transcriptional regulator C-terminal domain-containing protein [Paenibacillus sp. LHD-117]MDQ6422200.1 TetR family transcriptional regulator C-terminal domain-containing protein [Paenibacillus sp. LHD-117]
MNHDQRREQLAEAAWRVIRREGLEGVSVRSVAEEAGMSLGSLRHYFVTQSELLAFSMRLVSERVEKRIRNRVRSEDLRQDIEAIIRELVPLDEERLAECEVWLAFIGSTLAYPSLRALSEEVHDALYHLFREIVDALIHLKLAKPGLDAGLEAMRLHALVDGLVVHGVMRARKVTPDEITRTVAYHLDSIMK